MVVIKWLYSIQGQRVKVDGPQCGGLYKELYIHYLPCIIHQRIERETIDRKLCYKGIDTNLC